MSAQEQFEVKIVGKSHDGLSKRYDVWDNVLKDWVGTVPPMPTRNKERAVECARYLNARNVKS